MNSPVEEIKKAVAENRTGDALSRLLELSKNNKQLHDAIHIILAEFNDLTSQRLKGTIDNSEATRRTAVIHDKILVSLGAFDSRGKVLPENVFMSNGQSTKFLLKTGLSLLIFAVFAVMILVLLGKDKSNDWVLAYFAIYRIGIAGVIVLGGWLLAALFNTLKSR